MIGKVDRENILVIKHGALGDFVLSTGPFKAIREFHSNDSITLLTSPKFIPLAKDCGWFDKVISDERPKIWNIRNLLTLRTKLRNNLFKRVYDLQTSRRSSSYFFLFPNPKPEWSGIVRGCSHEHNNLNRDYMHTIERQAEQLKIAGILDVPLPDISWLSSSLNKFDLPEKFVLFVPGGSPHRAAKRWPVMHFSKLAEMLLVDGITPLLIGSNAESKIMSEIAINVRGVHNFCGKTDIADIASLARKASAAVGNDTGPMHVIASAGCPSLVLFSHASEPSITSPRGPSIKVLQSTNIQSLIASKVKTNMIFR